LPQLGYFRQQGAESGGCVTVLSVILWAG